MSDNEQEYDGYYPEGDGDGSPDPDHPDAAPEYHGPGNMMESGITLQRYQLQHENVNMARIRQEEGEDKFFLRQMILTYHYLQSRITVGKLKDADFEHIHDNILPRITFHTKKSPIGLLVAYYLYKPSKDSAITFDSKLKSFVTQSDMDPKQPSKFISSKVIPFGDYNYNTRWIDVFRYFKLFQNLDRRDGLNRVARQDDSSV